MKGVFVNGASGRIGRAVTYEFAKTAFGKLGAGSMDPPIVGINDIVGIDAIIENYNARDPVHGVYDWKVEKDGENTISINSRGPIPIFCEKDISKIPFKDFGLDVIVAECSGFYGDPKQKDKTVKLKPEDNLSRQFIQLGAERVVQTYPAKTADISIIMGVNHGLYDPELHKVISNASCTTKSLAIPSQVMLDNEIIVDDLRMVTVHAATASQKVLESLGQIVTHSTGAAKAMGEVIPSLKGKMGGTSARVPTLDGSVSYMFLVARSRWELTAESLNDLFRKNVNNKKYAGRLGIIEGESISSADIVGRRENALIIPFETQVSEIVELSSERKVYHIMLASGYDNELGSSVDPMLLIKYIASK
jgi:glyceraldehyde 3-phosphate dehydrogenase